MLNDCSYDFEMIRLPFTGHGIIDRGCRELAHRQPLSILGSMPLRM